MFWLFRILPQKNIHFYREFLKRAKTTKASNSFALKFNEIKHKTKVPLKPIISTVSQKTAPKITIDRQTLELLERLSLVNLSDKEALQTLEESIEFASKILEIDTTNIEPLYFVNEDQSLELREDNITEGKIRDILLENAPITGDECFIAPPGNVPVELDEKKF